MQPIENPVFLYIEDDPLSQEIVQVLVEDLMGYPITVSGSHADIIERIQALPQQPNICLLDIHMAPLTGFDILARLRASPDFQDVAVIALTASVMNEEIETLRDAGFDSIISKPIDQNRFPRQLKRIMRGQPIWQI